MLVKNSTNEVGTQNLRNDRLPQWMSLPAAAVREFFLDARVRRVGEAIGWQSTGSDVGLVGALGVLKGGKSTSLNQVGLHLRELDR